MSNFEVSAYIYLFFQAYVVAGGCEELLKYILIDCLRSTKPGYKEPIGYGILGIAAGLGFSVSENIMYQTKFVAPGWSYTSLFMGAFMRLIMATPLHVTCGYLTGLRCARKDIFVGQNLNIFTALIWSIIIHGTYDYLLFISPALIDTRDLMTQILFSLVVAATSICVALLLIARERKIIKRLEEASTGSTNQAYLI